jgi:hypothetical protein
MSNFFPGAVATIALWKSAPMGAGGAAAPSARRGRKTECKKFCCFTCLLQLKLTSLRWYKRLIVRIVTVLTQHLLK